MSDKPWLVLVGGFLGSGKTSLIMAAARELERRGMRSAVILNDQGDALVDTAFAERGGLDADQVTGGCFCCRLSDMVVAAERLRAHDPEVIFAEPVGSCTDLSATIIQPLRLSHFNEFRLAPYTLLVDPAQATGLLEEDADENLSFLFRKQLEEADLVCSTKSDLHHPPFPGATRELSARTGQGVAAWVDEVLSGTLTAGQRILEIDYDQYARAEAALAWLNLEVDLECPTARSPAMLLGPLLDDIDGQLTAADITLVHMKAIDSSPEGYVKAAQTSNGQEPQVEGPLDASPSTRHHLLLNLRASGEPVNVQAIVEHALAGIPASRTNERLACFSPARPVPEQRFDRVV